MRDDVIQAHKHSARHREEIERSEMCGCFYCLNIYPPNKIEEWTDNGVTAHCPNCWIDSVIGSASGYPITEAFLKAMNKHWF